MKFKNTWFTPALLALAIFAGACGKSNESGKSSSTYYSGVGTYTGTAPVSTNNSYVNLVFSILPCSTGVSGSRTGVGIPLTGMTVASNSTYLGISAEGDISVITSDTSGTGVLSLYLCPRSYSSGVGNVTKPAIGVSYAGCRVNPITAMNVTTGTGYIAFYGLDAVKQLGAINTYQQQLVQQICY